MDGFTRCWKQEEEQNLHRDESKAVSRGDDILCGIDIYVSRILNQKKVGFVILTY